MVTSSYNFRAASSDVTSHVKTRSGVHTVGSIGNNHRIYSPHSLSGIPTSLEDEMKPDWLPLLNLGHDRVTQVKMKIAEDRCKQRNVREESATMDEAASVLGYANTDDKNSGKIQLERAQNRPHIHAG